MVASKAPARQRQVTWRKQRPMFRCAEAIAFDQEAEDLSGLGPG